MLVSQSEFGRIAGISRQAVADAIKRGAIIVTGAGRNKKIDLENPANKHYLNDEDNGQRKKKSSKKQSTKHNIGVNKKEVKKKKNIKQENKKEISPGRINLPGENEYEQGDLDLSSIDFENDLATLSKHNLDRVKIAVQIQKEKIKADKDRGQLVDVDIIKKVFGELYQIDRNEFLQSAASITSKICSKIIKIQDPKLIFKINKIIDDEHYKILEHIRITLNKYLENCKQELISRGEN